MSTEIVTVRPLQGKSEADKVAMITRWVNSDKQFWTAMLDSFSSAAEMLRVLPPAYEQLDGEGRSKMAKAVKMAISRKQPDWLRAGFTVSFASGKVGVKKLQDGSNKSRKGEVDTFDESTESTESTENATVANQPELVEMDSTQFELLALRRQVEELQRLNGGLVEENARLQAELEEARAPKAKRTRKAA